jgi:hypothetical protein
MEKSIQLVQKLVENFKAQEKVFLSPSYQESQARQDFIDKFLTAQIANMKIIRRREAIIKLS